MSLIKKKIISFVKSSNKLYRFIDSKTYQYTKENTDKAKQQDNKLKVLRGDLDYKNKEAIEVIEKEIEKLNNLKRLLGWFDKYDYKNRYNYTKNYLHYKRYDKGECERIDGNVIEDTEKSLKEKNKKVV